MGWVVKSYFYFTHYLQQLHPINHKAPWLAISCGFWPSKSPNFPSALKTVFVPMEVWSLIGQHRRAPSFLSEGGCVGACSLILLIDTDSASHATQTHHKLWLQSCLPSRGDKDIGMNTMIQMCTNDSGAQMGVGRLGKTSEAMTLSWNLRNGQKSRGWNPIGKVWFYLVWDCYLNLPTEAMLSAGRVTAYPEEYVDKGQSSFARTAHFLWCLVLLSEKRRGVGRVQWAGEAKFAIYPLTI